MKISKAKYHGQPTYNDYDVELSWGQLLAIKNALATDHASPIADELFAELDFYLQQLPGPGEDEESLKAAEEADKTGLGEAPPSDQQPLSKADELLPAPGEEEMGGPEGPAPGADTRDFAPQEGPEGGEAGDQEPPPAPEEEEEPVGAARGADERIPAPPRE